MRAIAGTNARQIVKRTPVPRGATALLDIGGSHGYYSVALCRKHPGLRDLETPNEGGQVAWIMSLYFALWSQSGAWSFDDMIRWQTAAGLWPHPSFRFRTIPGSGIRAATNA